MYIEKNKTKICKCCGRKLPLSEYSTSNIHYKSACKECNNAIARKKRADIRLQNALLEYNADESMKVKRQYKKINKQRVLSKSESGIKHISRDEKFVNLLDYKDTWVSTHGRIIIKENNEYKLLKGSYSRKDGELYYNLDRNVYFKTKKEWGYKKQKVRACDLVIQTFIVNYDIQNNTKVWHESNDIKDNYYRHLYPVGEKQYDAIKQMYDTTGNMTEQQIIDMVNAVEYKPDNWKPYYFRRSYEGVGYLGMGDVDCEAESYNRWKNMIQRCYNKKVHKQKPYYKNKSVCEEWLNYSNFRIWYMEHIIPGEKVDLDKDLLSQNNKVYSPETCAFLTHYINTVFEDRGIKRTITETKEGIKASMIILNKKIDIGTFDTKEEAYKGFIDYKKNYINELAESCKGKVQDCVYNAMLNWKVEITD